jgi:hypothetical protein
MKFTAAIIVVLYAFVSFAQDAAAPAPAAPIVAPPPAPVVTPVAPVITAPVLAPKAIPAPAVKPKAKTEAPATVQPAAPVSATPAQESAPVSPAAGAETTADSSAPTPPPPPKDPAQCLLARFTFDNSIQPDIGSRATIPTVFKRASTGCLDGAPFAENAPRFTEGRFGKALILEAGFENMFSAAQAAGADASAFMPLQNAVLAAVADKTWEGKECLSVTTPGANAEEGFAVEAAVEKAFYAKEAAAIVPAYYTASFYLKGQGNLKISLKDMESGTNSEPVYVDLPATWQRFQCTFGYQFKRINLAPEKEAEWRQSVTNNIAAKLQLICTTVDAAKMNFFADGFQLEKRNLVGGNPELSPHTWIPGGSKTALEQFAIDIKSGYFNTFKTNGTIAFWFKPLWESRDGSQECIMQIATNQLVLSHDVNKIMLIPAGAAFTPYDWKNNWHHIAITWSEAGERVLYVDGSDYPNTSGEFRLLKNPELLAAGDFKKCLAPNGAIDELTLYNAALTADQAKALASAEPAALPAPAPAAPEAPAIAPSPAPAASSPAVGAKQPVKEESEEAEQ